jgi:hypothetical protein
MQVILLEPDLNGNFEGIVCAFNLFQGDTQYGGADSERLSIPEIRIVRMIEGRIEGPYQFRRLSNFEGSCKPIKVRP